MEFCNLTGKTILVTGASSGIGKQTSILASRLGATLIITGRDKERLRATSELLEGKGHRLASADLAEEKQMDEMVAGMPPLDGLVHCAGVIGPTPAKFIRQENIDKMFRINFEVPVLLTANLLMINKMNRGGSIVFISSVATRSPYFGGALYASAKAALESYAHSLALELVGKGIRSNILSPALVNTPILTDPAKEGSPGIVDDSIQRYLKKYPMGVGEPTDVASLIVFLLSNEAKWISGSNIPLGSVIQ